MAARLDFTTASTFRPGSSRSMPTSNPTRAAPMMPHVVPLLRSNDAGTDTGRALYEAGAEQLYLLSWMAFDNGEHAVAQRYLIQALRLAQEAKSADLGAHVLAGLSDQATLTGRPQEGLQLARAGRAGLASSGRSSACLADLYALQARAEAAMGEAMDAAHHVTESEKAFAKVNVENEPAWAKFIDVAYLNGEYAHAFRDLGLADETARLAQVSITDSERQSRARRGSLAQPPELGPRSSITTWRKRPAQRLRPSGWPRPYSRPARSMQWPTSASVYRTTKAPRASRNSWTQQRC
jgi:hypothetical protein